MDRLLAILISLQQQPAKAQELADKFEVSRRTILRDMQSLSEMGIPVCSMPGSAGGYSLMEGFQLAPLELDSNEALTVLFALRSLAKMNDTPFAAASRWTVTDKIRAILPKPVLTQVEPMLEQVEIEMPRRKVKAPHLAELWSYLTEKRWIHALYRSANHQRWLQLFPRRLYIAHGFWYCDAYSVTHGERRTFRVDRFEVIREADKPDSAEEMIEAEALNSQTGITDSAIRIVARLTYRGSLLAEQDEHIGEHVQQISDEEWELDFICPSTEWNWAVRFFFTLGMDAEVLEPELLREEICSLANQLRDRYG
ncbi:helix-turn-helix transcriptional regulator [Paenibacillus senegalensis]|uniref:helix-turn-helix transcriptional regulator n=1 Tax=Paenibacillus senegalensis TaxID=1465766 RepID=UPI000287AA41|nr:WYL domain-containing protein [Paenibacillus senegalensis]